MGGMLTQLTSWRWTLLVNVSIAVVALARSRWLVSESRAEVKPPYDLAGTVTVTPGPVAMVYGFIEADPGSWGSAATIALLAAAVALLAVLVRIEARIKHPCCRFGAWLTYPGRRLPRQPAHDRRAVQHLPAADLHLQGTLG